MAVAHEGIDMMNRRSFLSLPTLALVPTPCVWGTPEWVEDPVLVPDQPYEGHVSMPYSDGCWWDEDRQRFRLWYMAGYNGGTALAESRDGYAWEKRGLVDPTPRDSSTVWQVEDGSYVRATYFLEPRINALTLQISFDGIHWVRVGQTPNCGDRSTIYRDGAAWILSARTDVDSHRDRQFYFAASLTGPWHPITFEQPDLEVGQQLYNFDAVAMGSGLLGLSAVWTGDRPNVPKRNHLAVLTSEDGISWTAGPKQWIPLSEDPLSWRMGNIQSCGGVCVALSKDRLGFYVSARSGTLSDQRCVTGLVTIDRKEVCL